MNHLSQIIAYENGELSEQEFVDLFQALLDDGTIRHLQGSYQRTCFNLIAAGAIQLPAHSTL
jgi:hypothetical protein